MKIRNVQIEVRPFKKTIKEAIKAYKDISVGKKVKKEKVIFEDLSTLRSTITPERIRLLHVIREKNPSSIYELAKLVKRNWRAVANDIELLKNIGLVDLKKRHVPKEVVVPTVHFNRLEIGITI